MDILYVLGRGSKWDNNELRYSLRSIEKYGKNVGKIYVVGYDPGFLSDKVTFIPHNDKYRRKHHNILDAICYAVKVSDIGEEFLLSSDDHFYVKETDFDNYPYFCKGTLPDKLNMLAKNKIYRASLCTTRRVLEKNGLTYYTFCWHGNTHFTREGIKKAKKLIETSFNTKYGCEPTCLILNTIYSYDKFPIVNRKDLKVKDNIENKEGLIRAIGDREVFSIYDKSIEHGVREYLEELFPEKSIYEK